MLDGFLAKVRWRKTDFLVELLSGFRKGGGPAQSRQIMQSENEIPLVLTASYCTLGGSDDCHRGCLIDRGSCRRSLLFGRDEGRHARGRIEVSLGPDTVENQGVANTKDSEGGELSFNIGTLSQGLAIYRPTVFKK